MASLGELFIELAFKGNPEKLEQFEKRLKTVVAGSVKAEKAQAKFTEATKQFGKEIGLIAGAIAGAVFALDRMTNSLVQNNNAMLDLTRQSDVALSTFQKWDSVGRMFGINNAAQQVESLNERLFELRLTGEGARGFQLAGIMPTNAEDVMEQLRNRIRGMDNTSATYLLKQMGLDPKMITLLRLSREEYDRLGNTMKKYQLTDEQRQQIQKMNIQLEIARQKLQFLKDKAIMAIMPYFVRFMEVVSNLAEDLSIIVKWVSESNNVVAKGLRIFLKVLAFSVALTAILKGIPLLLKGVVLGINAIRTALTLLMTNPWILGLTALIAGLMLLADDVNHYMNGGGSVIGVIAKAFEDFEKTGFFSDDVPEWLRWLVEVVDKLYKMYQDRQQLREKKEKSAEKIQNLSFKDKITHQEAQELIKGMTNIEYNPFKFLWKFYTSSFDDKFGVIPNSTLISPQTQQNVQNNNQKINKDNSVVHITQTNNIQTSETADSINKQLIFAQAQQGK